MRARLSLLLLLPLSLLLPSCLPDGKVDVEQVKAEIRKIRLDEDFDFPDKEEFRARAEREIIRMPLDDQPMARRQLDSMLRVYPSERQLDSIIRVVAESLPDEATTDRIVDEVVRKLPSKSAMKRAADRFIENLPEEQEIGEIMKVGIEQLRGILDSLSERPR